MQYEQCPRALELPVPALHALWHFHVQKRSAQRKPRLQPISSSDNEEVVIQVSRGCGTLCCCDASKSQQLSVNSSLKLVPFLLLLLLQDKDRKKKRTKHVSAPACPSLLPVCSCLSL